MYKLAAVGLASANVAVATTTPKLTVDKAEVGGGADELAKFANDAARIEAQGGAEWWGNLVKHMKYSKLEGEYADYRFFKEVVKRLEGEMHYGGPHDTCDAKAFATCVAGKTTTKCQPPGMGPCDERIFRFEDASRMYPECTKSSKCEALIQSMTPAQKAEAMKKRHASDRLLESLWRGGNQRQMQIWNEFGKTNQGIEQKYTKMHMANLQKHAKPFFAQFGCSSDCMMQKAHFGLPHAWELCKCKNPAGVHFSPSEVLELVDTIKFDRLAGIEEASEELAAQVEPAQESNNGWIAFAALATANAAFLGYKKMH